MIVVDCDKWLVGGKMFFVVGLNNFMGVFVIIC